MLATKAAYGPRNLLQQVPLLWTVTAAVGCLGAR